MATAELAGVVVEAIADGQMRVSFPGGGLRLNDKGVGVANLLRKESQFELSPGTLAMFSGLEELDVMVIALLNGVNMRVRLKLDDYFL